MEIVYVYQRLRKDFGRAPKFTDVNPDVLFEIMPNPEMMGSVLPAPAPAWVARAPRGRARRAPCPAAAQALLVLQPTVFRCLSRTTAPWVLH